MIKLGFLLIIAVFPFASIRLFGQEGASAPPNEHALLEMDLQLGKVALHYNGRAMLEARILVRSPDGAGPPSEMGIDLNIPDIKVIKGERDSVEQRLRFTPRVFKTGFDLVLEGRCLASDEAFPAETKTIAQDIFPLIRNSVGLSRSRRNNAVYDRKFDWMLAATGRKTRIEPLEAEKGDARFAIRIEGKAVEISFKPRFYQKHKNLPFFEPWRYGIWKGSICGWCSWWPYRRDISEKVVKEVSGVFADKLRDYGYEYVQIDDGYQAGYGGTPGDWLNTNERFPGGLKGLSKIIQSAGLKPAIWVNVHFGDEAFVQAHPGWFIRDADGSHHKGPWLDFALDGGNPEAVDGVIRPVYRALKEMGWRYVKIDTLRHLLYDGIYPCRAYYEGRDLSGERAFRNLIGAAREELGRDVFILACWGVLPEAVGIADGCRLGTDGFGPATLVQYNSWNNVVWRNDPDHVDITPEGEEVIRPVTVCMAGAMMMLTDKVEVYASDAKIEGARRSAPVPFTRPGQLYDFDPRKTDNVIKGLRNEEGGGPPGPVDADQWGIFSPWWLMEIDGGFEYWNVLARMDWKALPRAAVSFDALGLDKEKEYLVYEYWTDTFLGTFRGTFPAVAQKPKEVRVYAIREKLDRPQLLSTSRHILQGWPDLVRVEWDEVDGRLSGESRVVKDDPYVLVLRLPDGFEYAKGEMGGEEPKAEKEGGTLRISFHPGETGALAWSFVFRKNGD